MKLADLKDDPWIASSPRCGCRAITERACSDAGFEAKVAFEADETMAAMALVAAGVGVTIFPTPGTQPRPPRRSRPLPGPRRPRARVWAARLADGYRSPASEAMVQILLDVAGKSPRTSLVGPVS